MDSDSLSFVPIRAPGVSSRLVETLAVALTEADQTLHTFEGPVATHIWTCIDGVSNLGDILEEVLSNFEVERGRALDDLLNFVQLLKKSGLIEAEPGESSPSKAKEQDLK